MGEGGADGEELECEERAPHVEGGVHGAAVAPAGEHGHGDQHGARLNHHVEGPPREPRRSREQDGAAGLGEQAGHDDAEEVELPRVGEQQRKQAQRPARPEEPGEGIGHVGGGGGGVVAHVRFPRPHAPDVPLRAESVDPAPLRGKRGICPIAAIDFRALKGA